MEHATYSRNGETFKVHHVTEDTHGSEVKVVGGTRVVSTGEVLVETARPDVYDVYTEKDFNDLELGRADETVTVQDDDNDEYNDEYDETYEEFDPNEHNAREVTEYLNRTDVSDEEKERVRNAERAGKNRRV